MDDAVRQPTAEDAQRVIAEALLVTPLAGSETISRGWGCQVYFKLEMLHTTGSFKERGALYKLLSLSGDERSRGVVAASAGNHAQALAYHAGRLGVPCTIVMPETAPLIKIRNTANHGARVVLHGCDYDEAQGRAHELAQDHGHTYVPGFDDPWIMAGQGTIGLEVLEQCPQVEVVVVPVGGGGLIGGIADVIKQRKPGVRIIGVQARNVPSARAALDAGEPVKIGGGSTIADGIAVRRVGRLCLQSMSKHMDELVEVGESEIAQAILMMLEQEKAVVEGAGAVGVAALQAGLVKDIAGRHVVVVLSGGNIDVNRLARIIDKGLVKDGRLVRLRVAVPDLPGELARILEHVAHCRANILDVEHQRAFSHTTVGFTSIDLTLETRGADHVREIMDSITASNASVEKL